MKPLLVPAALLALTLTGCAGLTLPAVTVTERPAVTQHDDTSTSLAYQAMQFAWDRSTATEREGMCQAFALSPDLAYAAFMNGVGDGPGSEAFTRSDFDAFFGSVC